MHFGDSIFIFLLALVLFGPKKLPEIGRQAGKLLAEFRRASNEFKFQIQEELRNMEDEERRKKLAEYDAQHGRIPIPEAEEEPSILPPVKSMAVSGDYPYAKPGMPQAAEPDAVSEGSGVEGDEAEAYPPAYPPDATPDATADRTADRTAGEATAETSAAAETAGSASTEAAAEQPESPVKEIPVQEAAQASHHG